MNLIRKIKYLLRATPQHAWILSGILLLGIFLRTYNFREWLQFSPDQARDMTVVGNFIDGVGNLPLLGPLAAGTFFHLGPIVYYFQIISLKIFGNTVQAAAYPDLLFSVLAIPLLFLFLKKYFSSGISLSMSFLMSISHFAIMSSRSAWNPNSIPFFVILFLYAILGVIDARKKRGLIWPILIGISVGVGIQLHTLLLLIMPIILLVVLLYLWKSKLFAWKPCLVIFSVIIFLNAGQIIYEYQNNYSNTKEFFRGIQAKSPTNNILRNLGIIGACQVQSNANFIASIENKEKCRDIFKIKLKEKQSAPMIYVRKSGIVLELILSILFSSLGYVLLIRQIYKETEVYRKQFLILIGAYNILALIIIFPVAGEVSVRYFNILFFVPFVLLGIFAQELFKRGKTGRWIILIFFAALIISNTAVNISIAKNFANRSVSDNEDSILGEIELMAEYIVANSENKKMVYFMGKRKSVNRFYGPLNYLVHKNGIMFMENNNKNGMPINPDAPIFYVAKSSQKDYTNGEKIKGYEVKDQKRFQNITIFLLKNNAI